MHLEIVRESTSLVLLNKLDVPLYLRDSEFLKSWDDDGDAWIPASVFKSDSTITNHFELRHILQSLRFWIVSKFPSTVYDYVLRDVTPFSESVLLDFEIDMPQVSQLLKVLSVSGELRWTKALQIGAAGCVRYMFERALASNLNDCCSTAAAAGSLECLRFLHERGCPVTRETCSATARNGHVHCLKYLYDQNCEWGPDTCEGSAANGHAHCLSFAIEHGCEWSDETAYIAADHGHTLALDVLCKVGVAASVLDEVAERAARRGQLAILEYLHVAGHKMRHMPAVRAAQFGHLSCLQYHHYGIIVWTLVMFEVCC